MPYIGKTTDGFGVRNRFVYLASSGATSVSGADANGATLTFTDGAYVDVYLNGILLKPTTDYNTSTANTIAGLSALNTNDEVTVVVYDVFTVADMVSATSGGTFSGNVTVNGDITVGDDIILNSDSAALQFGADSEITLTHSADAGLLLKHAASGDDKFPVLTLQTGDTDIAGDDVLGKIQFQAPDEATGTDAQVIAAGIWAYSEGNFAADNNATSLSFQVAESGTAAEKLRIFSSGAVTMTGQPSIAMDATSSGAISFSGSDKLITEWTSFHTVGISFNSSNGRFTVPTAGKYLITVHIYLYQNDAFQRLQVLDNDSIFVHSSADFNNSDGDIGQDNTLSCTIIRDLSANDYITFTMLDGGGRIMMHGAHSHMSMHKLS